MKLHLRNRVRNAAFSLVEVTLAMGIAALGIIAVLGLMPQGMEMSRKTGEMTAHRQILEQITNNLAQMTWADLTNLSASAASQNRFFYDDQGAQVADQSDPLLAIVAAVDVQRLSTTQNSGGAVLPSGKTTEDYLMRAVIKVATTTDPNFDFSDDNYRGYITTPFYIAKSK
jgi:uncharacterized protein (TIGR02598 family)